MCRVQKHTIMSSDVIKKVQHAFVLFILLLYFLCVLTVSFCVCVISLNQHDLMQSIMKGHLKKKSPKGIIRKYWQNRYFVLYDDSLIYFRKKTDLVPAGKIAIHCVCTCVCDVCVC